MLLEEIKKIYGSKKQLKDFAHVVGGIFLVLGALFSWKGHAIYPWFVGIGTVLLAIRIVRYQWLQPLYKVWMGLALCMGFVVSRILLTILFYLVMTPISLAARLSGKKFLNTTFREDKESYWVKKEHLTDSLKRYENQY